MSKQKYIFFMVQDYLNFRFPEFLSICELLNYTNCVQHLSYSLKNPFLICNLDKPEIATEISNRSVLIKSAHSLIYEADSFEGMLDTIRNNKLTLAISENESFKINVSCFNKKTQQSEKVEKIEKLIDALKLDKCTVCLKDDEVTHNFWYFEEYEDEKENRKNLKNCYFAKMISSGLNSITYKYNLSDRSFIANTSMDPILAFIMSNMAKVKKNDICFDPFVGSGSLLVSSAHHGAFVMGADFDFKLLHSIGASSRQGQKYRKKEETIHNNLKQYNLQDQYIDVLVADSSSKYLKDSFLFDAIITDPPYGIREKTVRVGERKKNRQKSNMEKENSNQAKCNEEINSAPRFTQSTQYLLSDVFKDLLQFAAQHLVEKGRLTFWLPVYIDQERQSFKDPNELTDMFKKFIPKHPKLRLIGFSEQNLSTFTSRLLITMEYDSKLESGDEETNEGASHISSLDSFRNKYFGLDKK